MADNSILNRLDGLKLKYEETGQKLTDPEVIADVKQFIQLTKEYKELEPIIETSERYRTAIANLAEAKDTLATDKDEEMREMAREMIAELEPQLAQMEEEIEVLASDLANYAMRRADEDVRVAKYQAMTGRLMSSFVELNAAGSFATPELMAIPDETFEGFFTACPELERYRRYLLDIRRRRAHAGKEAARHA